MKLRSRLGLALALRPYFRKARRNLQGVLTDLLSISFGLVAFFLLLMIAYSSYQLVFATSSDQSHLLTLIASITLFLSLLLLLLMRQTKQQLDVVMTLQAALSRYAQDANDTDTVLEIPARDYQVLAALERDHLVQDRYSSLEVRSQQGQVPEYSVQRSGSAQGAMERLDPKTRTKVEKAIYSLSLNPKVGGAARPGSEALLTLQVPVTKLQLSYEVDAENRQIKIYKLTSEGESNAG